MTKYCVRCEQTKPVDDFYIAYKHKVTGEYIRMKHCIKCTNELRKLKRDGVKIPLTLFSTVREKKGISRQQIVSETCIGMDKLVKIEKGEIRATLGEVYRIADALGVATEALGIKDRRQGKKAREINTIYIDDLVDMNEEAREYKIYRVINKDGITKKEEVFKGYVIQETERCIFLANKKGKVESFLKVDFIIGEYYKELI